MTATLERLAPVAYRAPLPTLALHARATGAPRP